MISTPSSVRNSTSPIASAVSTAGPILVELRVRNLGVIDDVTVALGPGMTALTGETGAGKTLLVEALSLLLGGRADPSMVRAGTDEATIEGRFSRPEASGSDDGADDLVLARSVARVGRSRAWVDGRMASIGTLAERAAELIELHGQHQHRSLIHTDAQRRALDAYGHIDLGPLQSARSALRRLVAESEALGGDARQRAREVDLLRYQVDEIDSASIQDPDEDERLETEEDRLAAVTSHREAAAEALSSVAENEETSAVDRLAAAAQALSGSKPLVPLGERVRAIMADLTDLATELRMVVETWADDPGRLEELRQRRQLLHELQRKYGADVGEVLAFADTARLRLEAIDAEEQRARVLDSAIGEARRHLADEEASVAKARRSTGPQLAAVIEATLRRLAMPSARLSIVVEGEGPADQVTFLLGANPGEPMQPLAKAASGGELARTMLAVRLAVTESPGVMTFDEVDSGVGGAAASAVGAALADLARRTQVLVVTHLAQVAAMADQQVEVRKSEQSGRTRSDVVVLDHAGRVVELSRMLSGHPDSLSARHHAEELLEARTDPAGRPG
jgi:DNA repair protein RecN (Recombination protein N)